MATLSLARPDLLEQRCLIGGEWVTAAQTFAVTNPATGDEIARVPRLGRPAVEASVAKAREALPAWAARTAKDRAQVLRRWFELIVEHREDIARIMTAEQGKPIAEARGEVTYAASFIEWFAEEGKRIYGDLIPAHQPNLRIMVMKQPIGVAAAITPWNFPAAMITRKAGPALAAGCPMIVKPASATPLTALALCKLAMEAGIPPGILSCITGSAVEISDAFCASPDIRKISFTGSTEIGRELMRNAAQNITKLSLELGGNAPFIVFDDADLDAAADGAIVSKYRNAGQTCVCANRFFVHEKVYEAFAQKLAVKVGALKVGRGTEAGVTQGPLINAAALAKVEEHLADAKARGAKVAIGGRRHALGGTFYEPTVLTGVRPDMQIFREETFGPIAPLIPFRDDAEVVELANRSEFGLASYFYSRDLGRVWRVAEALEYGMVGVNTGLITTEVAPFGGMKQSGLGREGSKYGIEEFVEVKYICFGGIDT